MPATSFVSAIRRLSGTAGVWLTRRVTDTLCTLVSIVRTLSSGRLDMQRLSTLCLNPSPLPPLYLLTLGMVIAVLFTVLVFELLALENRLNRFLVRPCPRLIIELTVDLRMANSVWWPGLTELNVFVPTSDLISCSPSVANGMWWTKLTKPMHPLWFALCLVTTLPIVPLLMPWTVLSLNWMMLLIVEHLQIDLPILGESIRTFTS